MISLFINMRVTINVMLALKCKLLLDNCTLHWNKASILKIAYLLQTGSVSIYVFLTFIIRIYPANNNEPLVCPRDVIKWSPEVSRTFCHCTQEVLSSSLDIPKDILGMLCYGPLEVLYLTQFDIHCVSLFIQ
jgi:hypothetical protein